MPDALVVLDEDDGDLLLEGSTLLELNGIEGAKVIVEERSEIVVRNHAA